MVTGTANTSTVLRCAVEMYRMQLFERENVIHEILEVAGRVFYLMDILEMALLQELK